MLTNCSLHGQLTDACSLCTRCPVRAKSLKILIHFLYGVFFFSGSCCTRKFKLESSIYYSLSLSWNPKCIAWSKKPLRKVSWSQLWDVPGIYCEAIVDMPVCRKWVSGNWTEANEVPEIRTETKVTRASYWEEPNLKLWVAFNESDLHHHIFLNWSVILSYSGFFLL